jgi:hypothetical protein
LLFLLRYSSFCLEHEPSIQGSVETLEDLEKMGGRG